MKLHIGGVQSKEGWKILNSQKFPNVDYLGDISDLSQFEDGQFDEIYASHVLEHVPQKKISCTYDTTPDTIIKLFLCIQYCISGYHVWYYVLEIDYGTI